MPLEANKSRSTSWIAVAVIAGVLLAFAVFTFGSEWAARHRAQEPYLLILQDDATGSDVSELRQLVESQPGVASATYLSKAASFRKFKSLMQAAGEWSDELESLETSNPLPAVLEVRFKSDDESIWRSMIRAIEKWPGFKRTIEDADDPDWWFRYGEGQAV